MTNDDTQDLTPQAHTHPGDSGMTSTNAMTRIANTNGYQQQVSIDPSQPLHLSVTNASGEVQISTSSQAGIWIVVRRSDGSPEHDPDQIPVTVNVEGNTVSIHPDWTVAGGLAGLARKIKDQLQNGLNPNDWDLSRFKLQPDLNYDIRVQVPAMLAAGSRVAAKTASGKLTITDVTADVVAATASGRVEVRNIRGALTGNAASGAIDIERVSGSVEANTASGGISLRGGEGWTALRTVSGKIQVENYTLKNARIASVSGSVHVSGRADNAQDYGFTTVSGSVKLDLALPAGVTSTLTSRSASGSAQASGDWIPDGKRSWRLGTGEPGPSFRVKTVSGSLKAHATADSQVIPRHEQLPAGYGEDASGETGHGDPHMGHPAQADHDFEHEIEHNVEHMTNWAKDFARDFRKGFASLATPPQPEDPAPPRPPMPPQAPMHPADAGEAAARAAERQAATEERNALAEERRAAAEERAALAAERAGNQASQPWTWTSAPGAIPPAPPPSAATGNQTEPIAQAAAGDTPAEADAAETERLRVLEALERGEIDVDEALARLDSEDAQGA